jgi:hypothetical protein
VVVEKEKNAAVAKLAQATIAADNIQRNLQTTKFDLASTEKAIVEAEKNLTRSKGYL